MSSTTRIGTHVPKDLASSGHRLWRSFTVGLPVAPQTRIMEYLNGGTHSLKILGRSAVANAKVQGDSWQDLETSVVSV